MKSHCEGCGNDDGPAWCQGVASESPIYEEMQVTTADIMRELQALRAEHNMTQSLLLQWHQTMTEMQSKLPEVASQLSAQMNSTAPGRMVLKALGLHQ